MGFISTVLPPPLEMFLFRKNFGILVSIENSDPEGFSKVVYPHSWYFAKCFPLPRLSSNL